MGERAGSGGAWREFPPLPRPASPATPRAAPSGPPGSRGPPAGRRA